MHLRKLGIFCFILAALGVWAMSDFKWRTGHIHNEGQTVHDEGRTGHDEGKTGHDEGRTGHDEGKTGHDEGRTGRDEGKTGHDEERTGDCKLGFASCKVATLYPGFGSVPIPMFLDSNFKRFPKITQCGLPFGVHSPEEKILEDILSATGNYSLGEDLDSLEKKTCIIIGNGGILTKKSLGQVIDTFDVVVRLNAAPVKGYETDVGSKTTMRILYPQSCPTKTEQIEDQSLFVLSAFFTRDLGWFRHMVLKTKPDTVKFSTPVAQHVPRKPADMRVLNPYFIKEASFQLIGLPYYRCRPVWSQWANVPTTGAVVITMALHHCDRVAVAGFGYNMSDPDGALHYYENLKMSKVTKSHVHNIVKEKQFLAKLVKAGAIEDLTLGIM